MSVQRAYPLMIAILLLLVVGCTIRSGEASDLILGQENMPLFTAAAEIVATAIEIIGIVVIVKGALAATIAFVQDSIARFVVQETCRTCRHHLGTTILLGLEFLVAADIIRTVAVDRTFANLGILAAIIALRTFLSFALEIEIEGRLPWQSESS